MSEDVEFYSIADFPSFADESWLRTQAEGTRDVSAPAVRIVSFGEFVSTSEPTAEALLGTPDNTILPLGGMLLMYGDGGAGKTTLTIDAVSHLASGTPWIGIPVERPVRTLMIENEGPRGKFRQRLSQKLASWNGHPPFSPNVSVLEEPWTRFTLREPSHRETLAASVDAQEIDLIVMGPLVTLGMVGGGTPDEVAAFEELLVELRTMIARPVSLWIIHHENKAGDISGAWERVPDALCHVQARGNGNTTIVWRKTRWSSDRHGTSTNLHWCDGWSFDVVEKEEMTEEALDEAIKDAVRDKPGEAWTNVRGDVRGVGVKERDSARDRLLARGVLVNVPRRQGGWNLWLADDPELNRTDAGTEPERLQFGTPEEGDRDASVQPFHRSKGTVGTERNDRAGVSDDEWPEL